MAMLARPVRVARCGDEREHMLGAGLGRGGVSGADDAARAHFSAPQSRLRGSKGALKYCIAPGDAQFFFHERKIGGGAQRVALRKAAYRNDKAPVTLREFGRPTGRGEFDAVQFPGRIAARTLQVELGVDADIAKDVHHPGAEITGAQRRFAIRSHRDFGYPRQFGQVLSIFEDLREHRAPASEPGPGEIARRVCPLAAMPAIKRERLAHSGQFLAIHDHTLRHGGDGAEFGHGSNARATAPYNQRQIGYGERQNHGRQIPEGRVGRGDLHLLAADLALLAERPPALGIDALAELPLARALAGAQRGCAPDARASARR